MITRDQLCQALDAWYDQPKYPMGEYERDGNLCILGMVIKMFNNAHNDADVLPFCGISESIYSRSLLMGLLPASMRDEIAEINDDQRMLKEKKPDAALEVYDEFVAARDARGHR